MRDLPSQDRFLRGEGEEEVQSPSAQDSSPVANGTSDLLNPFGLPPGLTPYYQDSHVVILHGDCREILPQLPACSVQTCISSPPYFGLRDYGGDRWVGGDEGCQHRTGNQVNMTKDIGTNRDGVYSSGVRPGSDNRCCVACGATRHTAQIGLEQTPAAYVAEMTGVFEQVRRVLRTDGSLWLNLGDSYATTPTGSFGTKSGLHGAQTSEKYKKTLTDEYTKYSRPAIPDGLKPKDLIGIPWRVAFALQDAGWWLRSDIIWSKGNPMPESVTDRPTKAHEYLFLMAKAERYWYDQDAIREGYSLTSHPNSAQGFVQNAPGKKHGNDPHESGMRSLDFTNRNTVATQPHPSGRNKRSVWTVNTQPYSGAHFAVFPEKLIEPCILAGAPERSCAACGAPWGRVVERIAGFTDGKCNGCGAPRNKHVIGGKNRGKNGFGLGMSASMMDDGAVPCGASNTLGFQPSCHCAAATVPGVVLDPFMGSGTTLAVAKRLGRRAIGIEQSEDYCRMAVERLSAIPTPFQFDAYEPDEPEPSQPEQVALW